MLWFRYLLWFRTESNTLIPIGILQRFWNKFSSCYEQKPLVKTKFSKFWNSDKNLWFRLIHILKRNPSMFLLFFKWNFRDSKRYPYNIPFGILVRFRTASLWDSEQKLPAFPKGFEIPKDILSELNKDSLLNIRTISFMNPKNIMKGLLSEL